MLVPMHHQARAVKITDRNSRYGLFYACGTGKTISALLICRHRPMRTIVVCPKSIIGPAWLGDARHFPSLRVVSGAAASPAMRRRIIGRDNWDVLILNYEVVGRERQRILDAGVRRLIIDESSAMKNFQSQRTHHLINLAATMDEVYCMSGIPAPNGEHEYWGQLRCIAPETTPANYYRWAYSWFDPITRHIARDRKAIVGWKIKPSRAAEFQTMLASCSLALRKEDCLDLPEQIDVCRNVELTDGEARAYTLLRDELRAEFADGRVLDATMIGRMMKLRQLAGGGAYGDGGFYIATGDSKLDELGVIIEEVGEHEPLVIWAEFTAEIERIAKRFNAVMLTGRTPHDERTRIISEFGKSITRVVCNPRAVGHGITLTAASYAVYYSVGYSYELYAQSRDRIHRKGQHRACTYIHLLADGTCDGVILEAVRKKKAANEAMMDVLAADGAKPHEHGSAGRQTLSNSGVGGTRMARSTVQRQNPRADELAGRGDV